MSKERGHHLQSRIKTLYKLPSHNISLTVLEEASSVVKHRNTAIESFKLKRQSIISRQASVLDVDDIVKVLGNIDEADIGLKPLEQLRMMNAPLALKKKIRAQYTVEKCIEELEEKPYIMYTLKFMAAFRRAKVNVENFFERHELWSSHIKSIQSVFGSGIASYFIFLRWLLYLNIFNLTIVSMFLVVPQLLYDNLHPNLDDDYIADFNFDSIFTGSGYLSTSLLYYGHYTNETVSTSSQYNIPVSYFVTFAVIGIINLIVVTRSWASAYRQCSEINQSSRIAFCHHVFCSWDFGISNEEVAELKKNCIERGFVELLSRANKRLMTIARKDKIFHFCNVSLITTVILSLIGGLAYFMYALLEIASVTYSVTVLSDLQIAMFMVSISIAFYIFLKVLAKHEDFILKETHVYLTVIRDAVMRNAVLAVVVYFWVTQSDPDMSCTENDRGQEIYRFIVMNFVFMTGFYIIGLVIWKYLSIYTANSRFKINPPQFDVPFWINDLIYYQTLVWIGSFNSPLISLLFIIIAILNFYSLSFTITHCCQPDSQAWLPNFAHLIFLSITFVCFLLSSVETFYVLQTASPSNDCGPFRTSTTVLTTISYWISLAREDDYTFGIILNIFRMPSTLMAIFIFLGILLYLARVKAKVCERAQKYFEHQISVEGRDKVYLLNLYEDALVDSKQEKGLEKDETNQRNK